MRIDTAVEDKSTASLESAESASSSLLAAPFGIADLRKGARKFGKPAGVASDSSVKSGSRGGSTSRLSLVEGALALTVLYALIGAGIGAIAGSFLLGLVVGFATGVAAIAAILLISGASVVPDRSVERGGPSFQRQVFRS
jgi:hypothetical protein